MADVDLVVQDITRAGHTPTYNTTPLLAVDDFYFPNNNRVFVFLKNGATAGSVTFETVQTIDGLAVDDRTVVIAASTEYFLGPFPGDVYNNADRQVHMTFVTPVTMEIAILRAELT